MFAISLKSRHDLRIKSPTQYWKTFGYKRVGKNIMMNKEKNLVFIL